MGYAYWSDPGWNWIIKQGQFLKTFYTTVLTQMHVSTYKNYSEWETKGWHSRPVTSCWLPQTFRHTKGKYSNAGEKYHQNRDAMNLNLQVNYRIRKSCLMWWPMLLNPTLGRQRFQVIKNCTVKPCQRERETDREMGRGMGKKQYYQFWANSGWKCTRKTTTKKERIQEVSWFTAS